MHKNHKDSAPQPTYSIGDLAKEFDLTTRAIAEEMGLPVIEKRITRDELYAADEVFFTGTAAEVTPIREIDNREIGIGERGPITTEIQQRYFDIVEGKNPAYRHWLTYVK